MPGVKNSKSSSIRKRASAKTVYRGRPAHAHRETGSRRKSGRGSALKGDQILLAVLLVILTAALVLLVMSYTRYRMESANANSLTNIERTDSSADVSGDDGRGNKVLAAEMKINDFRLGGLSLADAAAEMKKQEENILSKLSLVKLTGGEKPISKTPYQLGLRLDIDRIMKKAEEENGKSVGRNPILQPVYKVDESALNEAVERIRKEVDQEGKDAEATGFDPASMQFTFSKEKEGRKLDVEDTRSQLRGLLQNENFDREIALKIERTPAGRTAEEMSAGLGLVASASTPIMYYSEGRNRNVQLAAERISGSILQPGESFSYNTTIGPMTEANGFVAAGIQDEFGNDAMGVGGGLCQPSTTLYQAAVRAGMQINVHNFHSTPVTYCPIGTDAMVTVGADLVFTNVSEYPYTIMAYFDGATLTFSFYGRVNPDGIEYDLYVEELESTPAEGDPRFIKDEKLAPGETEVRSEPRPFRHVKVYRKTYQNGVEIASELMYDHEYPGSTGAVAGNMDELPKSTTSGTAGGTADWPTGPDGQRYAPTAPPQPTAEESGEILYYVYDAYGNLVPVYAQP